MQVKQQERITNETSTKDTRNSDELQQLLDESEDEEFNGQIPLHIMDPKLIVLPESALESKYPNLMTVFGIWNNMVGSMTLVIPFSIAQAGLMPGFITITLT